MQDLIPFLRAMGKSRSLETSSKRGSAVVLPGEFSESFESDSDFGFALDALGFPPSSERRPHPPHPTFFFNGIDNR